jgi:hypothetical protein
MFVLTACDKIKKMKDRIQKLFNKEKTGRNNILLSSLVIGIFGFCAACSQLKPGDALNKFNDVYTLYHRPGITLQQKEDLASKYYRTFDNALIEKCATINDQCQVGRVHGNIIINISEKGEVDIGSYTIQSLIADSVKTKCEPNEDTIKTPNSYREDMWVHQLVEGSNYIPVKELCISKSQ